MSAILMGAVMERGPARGSSRYVLVAIADNADDHGFAHLRIETIAAKACISPRTAIRLIDAMEREGWLAVQRHVYGGRGNVYFLNLEKLRVELREKSMKSKMHLEFEQLRGPRLQPTPQPKKEEKPRDKVSHGNSPDPVDSGHVPGDNPQGVHVTKSAFPSDKRRLLNKKNRLNRCEPFNTPLPPSQASGGADLKSINAPKSARHGAAVNGQSPQGMAGAKGPESARHGCEVSGGSREGAVRKVMRECGIGDPRMFVVILRAMETEASKSDTPPDWNAIAERMIAARKLYVAEADRELFRCAPSGVRKFFGHGIWAEPGGWPYDFERLRQIRNARVGT